MIRRWATSALIASAMLATSAARARADATPQSVPFAQAWSTSPVMADDDWSSVPGIVGYSGADLVPNQGGSSPADISEDGASDATIIVFADRDDVPPPAGGIVEVNGADSIVAFSGSSQVDAPNLVVTLDSSQVMRLHVSYVLVDLSRSGNTVQPVALQYRVGTTGSYTNVAAAFVADASAGPNQIGQRTEVAVDLPDDAAGHPITQLRIITANAAGGDEWIGIDNLRVVAGHPPAATAIVTPALAGRSVAVQVTATVTPGEGPPSTDLAVGCDASSFGYDATLRLWDDGLNGDGAAGDRVFGVSRFIPVDATYGVHVLPCRVRDAQARVGTFSVSIDVQPWCGNQQVEPTETCEDGNLAAGDGCDASCDIEPGWSCSFGDLPSVCVEIDECAAGSADCVAAATCTNVVGSYTCACPPGYDGDGHAFGTGCTDVDECARDLDDCVDHAACTNTGGGFACACAPGWSGDGHAGGSGCADVDECAAMTDDCSPDATCTDQDGAWACACRPGFAGDGVSCAAVCGDGLVVEGEGCDDGDDRDDGAGDGCDACAVEAGWTCTGAPSSCAPLCAAGASCDAVDPEPPGGGCATGGGAGGALALTLLAWSILLRSRSGARRPRPGAARPAPRA